MSDYLMHHGIKDQKWYRRRFQNKDGSLTPAGKRRYGKWEPAKKKNVGLKELKNVDGSKRYAIESEDGTKVGNISTYHQSDDSLRVSWIGVENKFKRDGYASSAMEKLKEDAIKNGYKKMSVVIPKDKADIQHIYERLGFKSSNANLTLDEFQDSITTLGDVVKMELDLTHSDELMHYGVSKDNGASGRGSGRYPKGSGKRPFQREGKEKRVFVSGSSKTQFDDNPYYRKELPKPIRDELDKFIKESAGIIVGDAPGIDRQVQDYLKSLDYQNVTVYGPGKQVRYNANPKWATRPIDAPEFEEGSKEWLAKKDIAMTNDSTEGLAVILDEGVKATRKNVARMKEQGKEVKVYELSKEAQEFDHWVDELLDEATHSDASNEELYHYGVGPDDDPPGRGSGRYAKGTGKDPYQHDPVMKKKMGLFDAIGKRIRGHKQEKEIEDEDGTARLYLESSLSNNKTLMDKYKSLVNRTYGERPEREHGYPWAIPNTKDPDREKLLKDWKDFTDELHKKSLRNEALTKAREVRKVNKEKAAAEKAERDKHEAEKQSAIASGDPERISKFLSEMSNQEQRDAITRISQMKTLNDSARAQADARARAEAELAEKNRPRTKAEIRQERIDNLLSSISSSANKIDKLRDAGEKFIKAYNLVATVNNSLNSDKKLKKIDFGNNEKKDDKKDK